MADSAKWYVIHTYSGYENAVKAAIEKSVTNRHCEDMVLRMEIPMETVTEVTKPSIGDFALWPDASKLPLRFSNTALAISKAASACRSSLSLTIRSEARAFFLSYSFLAKL